MIYAYDSRVRYSEIDENAQMTLFSLVNNLQDCCTFHGEEVGVGLRWNMERGHAWIVANLQMYVRQYPQFGDRIRVSTWAVGLRGMIAQRNFRVELTDGTLLAEAATEWVFMDMVNKRPIRIPEEQGVYGLHPEETLSQNLGKRKIRLPEAMEENKPYQIHEYHLDTNRHVNNAQYVRMALRYLPQDFEVHHMRVEFKKQALLGDDVVPLVSSLQENGAIYVKLADKAGDSFFLGEFLS